MKQLPKTSTGCYIQRVCTNISKTSTRVSRTSRTILDLIITTRSEKIQEVSTVLFTLSDHYPVYINIKKTKIKIKKIKVIGRNYRKFLANDFSKKLNDLDWTRVTSENNPEKNWDILQEMLLSVLDEMAPKIQMKVTKSPPPWMDNKTREFIQRKNSFLKQACKSDKNADWIDAKRQRIKSSDKSEEETIYSE